ncbi:MAG: hypothetical protein JXR68_00480 [Bacteroidales bacterium]|nr:hypothetical protein [Bacteroidales bacterium]
MRKLKNFLIFLIIISVIGVFLYFIFLKTETQLEKIEKLNDEIALLKTEYQPIKFKVTHRQNGQTTVLVKFFNLESQEVGKQEFTLKGTIVSFDFMVVQFDNGYLALPYKIFTDEIEAVSGIELYQFYEKNGFPQTLFKKDASNDYNNGVKALFDKIKSGNINDIENIFGSMVQNNSSVVTNNRDIDQWFKIISHTAGGIEIIEE